MPDPIIGEPPVMPAPEGRPEHERKAGPTDWVVVDHVTGEGARSKLESAHRELEHADIPSRIEHDHNGRIVLEVHRERERDAASVLGRKPGHGNAPSANESEEERIEREEHGALKGVFKLTTAVWFVVAIVAIFVIWYLFAFVFGFFK